MPINSTMRTGDSLDRLFLSMKTLSVGAKTLLLLGVLGALSILVRVLLPDEIGTAAVAILGCIFVAWLVYLIWIFVSHRRESAPPED
jgi:cellulose synthase/poly-beta-1,6-N-acetylglucosamine synthase-like glycosyltransferase